MNYNDYYDYLYHNTDNRDNEYPHMCVYIYGLNDSVVTAVGNGVVNSPDK
jgi:hypothetical protein